MDQLIFPLAIFVILYFIMIRPQQKQIKQMRDMMSALKKGDHIVTAGGLHGIIEELNDDTAVIDCEGVYLTIERYAIKRLVSSEPLNAQTVEEKDDHTVSHDDDVLAEKEVVVEDIVTDLSEDE